MNTTIRKVEASSLSRVSGILIEAADWLKRKGQPLWDAEQLVPAILEKELSYGEYYLAQVDGEDAGVFRFQMEDSLFWPESPADEATYIHRLSVRRSFAGRDVARALVKHAVKLTKEMNRPLLRLDCESTRPKLRTFYEGLGFDLHSLKQVGHFSAARYEMNLTANKSVVTTPEAAPPTS
ncbi:GNAT family N-acetyltransferase [Pelagicoccus mobilis]|uniref:GNAT family N-acetyltransferase n=1 Tax=Pelagicoccus mobilis TaxID=415221 RepID=A0A934VUK0_9BACT|nr:GNAT family N-acetyltransferase [Pelagicoccus mobilis]MBK1880609.1 GNAT family N-acetyltransferase [Pelagicoccus mobilis]